MKLTYAPLLLIALATLSPKDTRAQAGGSAICGPNCAAPGRVVLCNDAITGSGTQMINCGANALTGEATCASFTAPAGSFLRSVYAVLGPLNPGGQQFDLEVYVENGSAAPGTRIAATAANSYALEGDPGRFQLVDVTSLGDSYPLDGRFRVCLRKQFEDGHNLCLDSNGEQGDNWVYDVLSRQWFDLSLFGPSGDFILRPELEVTDLAPWLTGGECDVTPTDAGISDASPAADAAPADADAGVGLDALGSDAAPDAPDATSPDAASPDATSPDATEVDGSQLDASIADADPGDGSGPVARDSGTQDDAGVSLPPEITAVSPKKGVSSASTDVIVTGRSFVDGLSLRIGQIPAIDVRVLGSTTINAVVPAHIAAGLYDIVVINPDGQSAILAGAFEVVSDTTEAAPEDGCSCRTSGTSGASGASSASGASGTSSSGVPVALILAALVLRRSRRG